MSTIVAIGAEEQLAGYSLAGVDVRPAETAETAIRVWDDLPDDVGLILMTPAVGTALGPRARERSVLWAVLPS